MSGKGYVALDVLLNVKIFQILEYINATKDFIDSVSLGSTPKMQKGGGWLMNRKEVFISILFVSFILFSQTAGLLFPSLISIL